MKDAVKKSLNSYIDGLTINDVDKILGALNKEYDTMTNDEIKQLLPAEIINSSDVKFLRNVREYVDGLVQMAKDKDSNEHIVDYRVKYVNAFLLFYGKTYTKASTITNQNDITIAKIHSVDYVLHSSIKCHATVINIKYCDDNNRLAAGLNATNFDCVSIRTYNHSGFNISLDEAPYFLTPERVKELVDDATKRSNFSGRWFLEETGILEKTDEVDLG